MSPKKQPAAVDGTYTLDDQPTQLARRAPLASHTRSAEALARYEQLGEEAKEYDRQSRADNTRLAYIHDWRDFDDWCHDIDEPIPYERPYIRAEHARDDDIPRLLAPATPDLIKRYITHLARSHRKITTIERRLSSISQLHQIQGWDSPTKTEAVRTTLKGIRRSPTTNKHNAAKAALSTEQIRSMIGTLAQQPNKLQASRDKALLLLLFAGALRRSEAHALNREHVVIVQGKGMIITLVQSKTSQEAAVEVTIKKGKFKETCPVEAMKDWLKQADIHDGPIFLRFQKGGTLIRERLSDRSMATIIKHWCQAIGLNPENYGGHSPRAGFVTEAEKRGIPERLGMKHTRHKTERVYRGYSRNSNRWAESMTDLLGL